MIVDASAIVAMLLGEPEAEALAARLEAAQRRITHPLSVFEAAAAVNQARQRSVLDAYRDVAEFLALAGVEVVPLGPPEAVAAVEAFSRFGKGQGHPAALNMGDCFSYACAQVWGVPLLFKGEDFSRTDLGSDGSAA
jgi:ribonuclease VapC